MRVGPNIMRRGAVRVNNPAGGAAASAVTLTGTVDPGGMAVETAWGPHPVNPPAAGWGAATLVAATGSTGWTRTTTRPAAGTWYLHARIVTRPAVRVASSPMVAT